VTITKVEVSAFEFTGNHLCLDFANTVNERTSSTPRELLNSYDDLVRWSQEAGILSEDDAQRLHAAATQHPEEAEQVLQQALELREAIYRIFSAHISDTEAHEDDLATLNRMLTQAMARASVHSNGKQGFAWDWDESQELVALDRMLWSIVRSVAELLTSEALEFVRMCAADYCGWLFLDTSKNHSRRWCDMKGCGNRAKARKYYKKGQTGE
jgi:predicted RNA-binding Zn ribbon-like protein